MKYIAVLIAVISVVIYSCGIISIPSWYQLTTAVKGIEGLFNLSSEDINKCIMAYQYLQNGTRNSNTSEETEHVRSYYKVLNEVLSIADIEKMYIPPEIDDTKGLFGNQLIIEQHIATSLNVTSIEPHLLDIGCGRGRISYHMHKLMNAKVSGFNIDENQIKNAIDYAEQEGLSDYLYFKVGDHHQRFEYDDNTFDGAYSFQAIWPFLKVHELHYTATEIFRVLKPGSRFSCSEYLLTPHFNWDNEEHVRLHQLYLPTLAATQSMYPKDVTDALQNVGFKLIKSSPSEAPAWPITDKKTNLFLVFRRIIIFLNSMGLMPQWTRTLVDNLLLGGQAWKKAERMKIADLNWQIVVEKPLSP